MSFYCNANEFPNHLTISSINYDETPTLYIRDLKQTGRQRDHDGYSNNDIPDLVQKK